MLYAHAYSELYVENKKSIHELWIIKAAEQKKQSYKLNFSFPFKQTIFSRSSFTCQITTNQPVEKGVVQLLYIATYYTFMCMNTDF